MSKQTQESRKEFFLKMRDKFNTKQLDSVENATLFFFLNRTCFNGLYRVNKSGSFNVPFGKYEKPMICDPVTIYADSEILQRVEIMTGDFEKTITKAKDVSFFYFDPPYRPLSNTSSFNDYAKEAFKGLTYCRLNEFCNQVEAVGYKFVFHYVANDGSKKHKDMFNTNF